MSVLEPNGTNTTGDALPGDDPSTPFFLWGPLHALEKIGEGGFGEVYRAFEPVLQREVALKLARADRFHAPAPPGTPLEEARRLARVRHPNVLVIHGIEEHDGRVGMWTEYVHGETLEALLASDGPLDPETLIRTGVSLCRALCAVHAAGIVHGDVKAGNVMRESGGRIVLMDFGAGAELRPTRDSGDGGVDEVTGSPLMMAPELFEGHPVGVASDIYAAGVLLYRLATGKYPFSASGLEDLIARVRAGDHVVIGDARPDLPRPLGDVIERAMALVPSGRFPTAVEFGAALESCSPSPIESEAGAHPAHLPREIGRFIGREDTLVEIRRLVLSHPLVTLVGVGGCGKTRLALRIAAQLQEVLDGGAHWIDLAPLESEEAVAVQIARAVGLPERGRTDPTASLIDHLRERTLLLVLDNGEHVRAVVAGLLERILPSCPRLRVLVTSREDLGIPQEVRFDVPPMHLPDPRGSGDAANAVDPSASESVRLFVDRARACRPDFVLTRANAPAIARICHVVDGIPLAIELAAARVTALGTDQIAARLDESFRLLSGGRGDGTPHHRTMLACIDWSFRLLSLEEQALLCRLSVFAGRWSLEGAERTCADSPDSASGLAVLGTREVEDLLTALVEKSLVQSETRRDEERERTRVSYRMLEMIRQFARERLQPEDEAPTRMRMLSYYEALAEQARPEMSTAREGPWIARFAEEHDNFRVVLDGCAGGGAGLRPALRIATVLRRYWLVARRLREGLACVERLLLPHVESERDRADAYFIAASLAVPQADYGATRRYADEALPRMRALGDRKGTAAVLSMLGIMAVDQADFEVARECLEESIAIDRELGNLGPIPNRLNSLGIAASRQNDHTKAEDYFSRALELFRQTGNLIGVSTMLSNLSTCARIVGQPERARSLAEEAMEIARRTGHGPCVTGASRSLAIAHIHLRDYSTARRQICDALRLEKDYEDSVQIVWCLEGLGQLEQEAGHPLRAIRVIAAAEAIRDRKKVPIPEPDRVDRTQRLEALRITLGERAFAEAWAGGRAMSAEEAVEFALSPPE